VTGVPQLRLNSGGVANYVSGSGTNVLTFSYTVGAGDMAADLDSASTTALELNGGTITKPGGFAVARTLPFPGAPGSLSAASDIWVDTADTASVVGVSSPAANGTYGVGAVIPITVSFDRAVNVTGLPLLQLNAHGSAVARYVSGSGTDTLTFEYTVGLADSASDLDYSSAAALIPNGGTIVSPITSSASALALPAPGSAGSLGAANDLFIGNPSVSLTDATYETVEGIGTFTVTVLRIGDPTGAVSVDYAVTAGTATADDYTVTSAPSPLTWADGDATPRQIVFQINDDALSEGRESLGIALSNLTGPATFGIDEAELTIRPSDGLVPGKFTDADGDVATISLSPKTGAGSLLVFLTNGAMPVSLLGTTGTDPNKTAVTVSVTKSKTSTDNGTFPIGGVFGSGVKTLNLSKSPITGEGIRLAGMVQSLTVDSLVNGADVVTTGPAIPNKKTRMTVKKGVGNASDFVLNAPVSTFTAGSVGDGRIEAPSIGTLSVKGDFAGDVAVSGVGVAAGMKAFGTMKVGGTVDGSAIDVAGIVGSVTVGSFLNSHLFAGYTGDDVGGGTFDPAGVVTSFLATGRFANSSVIAATVKTVTLAGVDGPNAGDKFGIYADASIRSVVVKDPKRTFTNPTTLTGFDDFEIEVV
jgi:large repetitive protein